MPLPVEPLQERRDGSGAEQREGGEVGAVEPLLQRARQEQQGDTDHGAEEVRDLEQGKRQPALQESEAVRRSRRRARRQQHGAREKRDRRETPGHQLRCPDREELAPASANDARAAAARIPQNSTSAKAIGTR
jgi:hypothetical protein